MDREEVKSEHKEKKEKIEDRLNEFKELRESTELRLFQELIFVILTSQTSAKKAWEAVQKLEQQSLLLNGSKEEIAEVLQENEVQYEENKADYIIENRENLSQPTLSNPTRELKLSERINPKDLEKTRDELVKQLKGVGYKSASHFLRNIGYGDELAIISGHIIQKMNQLGVKVERPKDREDYLEAEEKFRELSRSLEIPVQELDLVLWSMETGEIFK